MSLNLAKKIAEANDFNEKWMLGCVIVKGGSVLSVGMNKPKNDPAYIDFEHCSIHAEVDALKKLTKPAKGCVMYVARYCKGGDTGLAKPCSRCALEIRNSGVKRVVYTIDNNTYGVWNLKAPV